MRKSVSYKNPWWKPGRTSPKQYTHTNAVVKVSDCGRGMIVKVLPRHFDYVVNGRVVTQRCGSNMGNLDMMIAFLLDGGPEPDMPCTCGIRRAYDRGVKQ